MKKFKVLHVTNHVFPCIGGIETYVLELAKELNKKGIYSEIVCLNKCHNSDEILLEASFEEGIKIHRIPFIDLKYYKIALKVLSFVKEFDLIHIHGLGFFADYLILTKLLGLHSKKLVVSTGGGIFHTRKLSIIKWIYFNLWLKFSLNKSHILAIGKTDFESFSKIVKKENLGVIEIPFNLEKFKLKKKQEKNSFIFVGRISKNKRVDNLIITFAELIKLNSNVKLKIIGKDFHGLTNELTELIQENKLQKNVFLLGERNEKDLLQELAKAEYFVSASEFEGFGISLIEGMTVKLIPIVNNINQFRTIINNNTNGFLVDYSNHENAAKKINEIINLDNKEKQKIVVNASNFVKRFDWKENINKFIEVYEKELEEEK